MGVAFTSKGFDKTLRLSYSGFSVFRMYIAKSFSKKHGELYSQLLRSFGSVGNDFYRKWNEDNDEDLDLLLFHSDCDGVIRPKEAKLIYNSLSKLTVDFEGDDFYKEFYVDFLELLQHSYKRRVLIYFY